MDSYVVGESMTRCSLCGVDVFPPFDERLGRKGPGPRGRILILSQLGWPACSPH